MESNTAVQNGEGPVKTASGRHSLVLVPNPHKKEEAGKILEIIPPKVPDISDEKRRNRRPFKTVRRWLVPTAVGIVAVLCLMNASAVKELGKPKTTTLYQFVMPDLTSCEEAFAVETLEGLHARTEVVYMDSDLYDPGTVIKCSADPGAVINNGSLIRLYICRRDGSEVDASRIQVPECPVIRLGVTMTECRTDTESGKILCTFRNTTNTEISEIRFTLGFRDADEERLPNREYGITGLKLQPGESVTYAAGVENSQAVYVDLQKITLSYAGTGE